MENIFCAIGSTLFSPWRTSHWAVKPAVIAAIAGAFHVLAYSSPLSASVIPGFFIMASLIENVKNRTVGFWSSVLHHLLLNAFVLGVAYFLH